MTIGVGFKCLDGIVLAADTQYTRNGYRKEGPKIFHLFVEKPKLDLSVLIAGAGNVPYMRRAVEVLEQKLVVLIEPTTHQVQDAIEDCLLDFFDKRIIKHNPHAFHEGVFEMLIGLWTKAEGFAFLQVDDTAVHEVAQHGSAHATIGAGSELADYVLDLTCTPSISVEDAKLVAAMAVKAAKDHVDSCGGRTHISTLKLDSSGFIGHNVSSADITADERYATELYGLVQTLLEIANTEAHGDEIVTAITESVRDHILEFRKNKRERAERIAKRRKTLGL